MQTYIDNSLNKMNNVFTYLTVNICGLSKKLTIFVHDKR
jgi:hypothetical protein